ncbi:MAG: hypothetical protein HOE90_23865 [Bacteriovoracaceae bacterium]|jgi:tRNA threonylcarbamoyl adenosine modification protein (Sua5/YciO/YrdC/YwlC family)|nr:hypothetical protein [Bacteriovoracaceae bacterium]
MIHYVNERNIDDRILSEVKEALEKGEILAVPGDTNWLLTCNPFAKGAVEKLYQLKKEKTSHHFAILCSSLSQATDYAYIDNSTFRQIKSCIPGHFTLIFKAKKIISKTLKASKSDHQVGIRFIPGALMTTLIEFLGFPLLCTHVTRELLGMPEDGGDIYSYLIEESLSHQVSHIIDPGEFEFVGPTTVIDFSSGDGGEITRNGSGKL